MRFGFSQLMEGCEVPEATGDGEDSGTGRRFSLAKRREASISEWKEVRLG